MLRPSHPLVDAVRAEAGVATHRAAGDRLPNDVQAYRASKMIEFDLRLEHDVLRYDGLVEVGFFFEGVVKTLEHSDGG